MQQLFLKITLLLALIVITYAAIILVVRTGKVSGLDSYIAAINEKHARLARTASPKIIFVGGSNLMLGIDSERIEKELGLTVVNMGLNAGLGLRFMLNEIAPSVGAGDVIVIAPEYELFYGYLNGSTTLIEALTVFPQGVQYLDSPKQIAMMASQFPGYVQGAIAVYWGGLWKTEDAIVTRRSFNTYGDAISHLDKPAPLDVSDLPLFERENRIFDEETLEVLNHFASIVQARGARAVIVFPSIPEIQYRNNTKPIQQVYERLQRDSRIPVIGMPQDYVLPVNYFFDTVYHLNRQGRALRTDRIVSDLKRAQIAQR